MKTEIRMIAGQTAEAVGLGLAAGLAGTAAMTVSSTVESKIRHRPPSYTPAQVASKVLKVEPKGEEGKARLGSLTHWGYGTMWGGLRGALAATGLTPLPASILHLAIVWGTEQVVLPAFKVAPPFTKWGGKETAIDVWHHLVYEAGTSLAYTILEGPLSRRRRRVERRLAALGLF
ncbi:MAG: hypothetical protein ACOCVR_04860 [Myxococcota bacterium]